MKHVLKKTAVVLCTLVFLFGSMFEPFTCMGFRPVRSFVVHAEEDPGTTTATNTGIAALIAILMASGMRFVGDYETVIQPAVTQLWSDFSSYAGNQLTLAELGAGIAITHGYMRVSSSVNNAIDSFTAWYKQTFSQPTTGDVDISLPIGDTSYYTWDGTCMLLSSASSSSHWATSAPDYSGSVGVRGVNIINSSVNLYTSYIVSDTRYRYADFGSSACGVVSAQNSAFATTYYISGVAYYIVAIASGQNAIINQFPNVYVTAPKSEAMTQAIHYTYGAGAVVGDVSLESQSYELKDGYQLDNDQAKLLDIAGLAALAAALGLALENVTDLVNDIPLIYGYPWAQDFPDIYADTPADTIPWVDTPTSVIPADTPEYVPTTPSDTDSYKVLGLERVFPFSIPFDLYYLIQAFSATPETPHFTIGMYNPASRRMETQEINLQQFETYAQIFRVFVTAMYILALILITRKLIRS